MMNFYYWTGKIDVRFTWSRSNIPRLIERDQRNFTDSYDDILSIRRSFIGAFVHIV